MEKRPITIAFVLPHPDDEAIPFGLPAMLSEMGQRVELIALTKGDLGSHTIRSRRKIARIRKREFERAGEVLNAHTAILGFHDGDLPFVEKKAGKRLLKKLRQIKADVVITTDRNDYHDDHQAAHRIARWASFHISDGPITTRRGFFGRKIPPVSHAVSFYSMDTQGSQEWQNMKQDDGISMKNLHPVNMILAINEPAIYQSIVAFKQHRSQLSPNGTDYVALAEKGAARRGRQAGFRRGVGLTFQSFGGYAFSSENVLANLFGKRRTKILM